MLRSVRALRLMAAILLAATTLSSCTAGDPATGPSTAQVQSTPSDLRLPLLSGLLSCYPRPQAYGQALIGPGGGTLHVGPHTLVVPAGALAVPTLISGVAPSDPVASVEFEPHGLQFHRTAKLTLDYSNCPLGGLQLLKRVAYTSDDLDILSYLLSRDNILLRRVTGDVNHFSRYAVAW